MAKGSAMGLWRGKKGTSVFYKITNSNDAQKQGIRERVYKIKNPQTAAQLNQRMKQVPAQRIAAALDEVIKRSFEGVEYGAKSRQEFLKYALSMEMRSNWPKVDRYETRPVPGEYLISKGSLDGFKTFPSAAGQNIITQINFVDNAGADTIGVLSELILENNPQLKAGDQLTFIVCISSTDDPTEAITPNSYRWTVASFYLNPDDTTNSSEFLSQLSPDTSFYTRDGKLGLDMAVDGVYPCASAVIVSRLSGTSKYLRSTATINIDDVLLAAWFTTNREDLARTSYMKTQSRSTNWPVDIDTRAPIASRERVDGLYALSGLPSDLATANGRQVRVMRYTDDNSLAAVYYKTDGDGDPCLVLENNAIVSGGPSGGGSERNVKVTDVAALASLPRIEVV